jgi:hypothetical protein
MTRASARIGLFLELVEFVEIYAGPEPERMGNGTRCCAPTRLLLLAETGTERSVDYISERQPEFVRAALQKSGQIVIDGECGAHGRHH